MNDQFYNQIHLSAVSINDSIDTQYLSLVLRLGYSQQQVVEAAVVVILLLVAETGLDMSYVLGQFDRRDCSS